MIRSFYICFSIFLWAYEIGFSQNYQERIYTNSDQLPASTITVIHEDSKGYLWMGTVSDGVVVFDGIHFRIYDETDGFTNQSITGIDIDKNGVIWIASWKGGLYTFNGTTFHKINVGISSSDTTSYKLNDIVIDSLGTVWLATFGNGILSYKNNQFTSYTDCGLFVRDIFKDHQNNLWFGTKKNGLIKYNYHSFQVYDENDGLPTGSAVLSIAEDSKGTLWVGTFKAGLYASEDQKIFHKANPADSLSARSIFALNIDSYDHPWVGYEYAGLYFKNDQADFVEIPNTISTFRCIYKDKLGNIWMSSDAGLYCYSLQPFYSLSSYNQHSILNNYILTIHKDSTNGYWISTMANGLFKYNFEQGIKKITVPSFAKVGKMVTYKNQTLFHFVNDKGLGLLDESKAMSVPEEFSSINNQFFSYLLKDSRNILWMGGTKDLYRFDEKKIDAYRLESQDGLYSVHIIKEDKQGNILFANSNGLFMVNESGIETIIESKKLNNALIIAIDNIYANDYWLATNNNGLLRVYKNKVSYFNQRNGLSANGCSSVYFDNVGNLWIGTTAGIDKITFADTSYKSYRIKHYGKAEGLLGMPVSNEVIKGDANTLWWGTTHGVYIYNPQYDITNKIAPNIQVTNLKLNYQEIKDWSMYADSIMPWNRLPYQLKLPFDQNHLTFQFIGVNLSKPEKVKYQWKLEGFENDWSPVSTTTEAVYANLSPGTYTFKVKSCNEDGVWNEIPAEYAFEILPPFWQTWWFRIVALAMISLIGWRLISLRIQQERLKSEMKEKQLEADKKAVEAQKQVLELEQQALRSQMNPHFIFNALNSIQGFIASNDSHTAERFLSRFARLMRLILESSREKLFPLDKELQMLHYYLDIQRLCYNNKFNFNITIDPNLETESVLIPPMLIQPYIENAIVHGVIQKESNDGMIKLSCIQKDNYILIELSDNGIGREKAQELKAQLKINHKSIGLLITQERMNIFNNENKEQIKIEIIDLKDDNNNAIGTKVILIIPLQYSI